MRPYFVQPNTHRAESGFSLTEVAMAIAVVAFAFVSLLALIPSSLETFRKAVDTTVTTQIAQRIISEAQETDFDFLVDNSRNGAEATTPEFSRLARRYYDDQGNELKSTEQRAAIYQAVIRVSQPGPQDQTGGSTTDWFTSLPATGTAFRPRDMTIVTLEIVSNPTNTSLPFNSATLLLDPAQAREARLTYLSYSAIIARNGRTPVK